MKYFFLSFFISAICLCAKAQTTAASLLYTLTEEKMQQKVAFEEVALFKKSNGDNKYGNDIVTHYASLSPDRILINDIFTKKNKALKLSLPGWGNQSFTLLLTQENINSVSDFFINAIEKSGTKKTTTNTGLHYRGYIQGDTTSLACISIFSNGDVMGLFAGKEGNFILGKMKGRQDEYVLYKSEDMKVQPRYECGAGKLDGYNTLNDPATLASTPVITQAPSVICNKVRVYWEADYGLFRYNFGSDFARTSNYVTGLFNIFSTLYFNEGIIVELSEVSVWTFEDPYSSTGSSAALTSFKSRWNGLGNTFNGDVAHLLAGDTTNYGGIAYVLSNECGRSNNYAYSNIYGHFQQYPNYSWDVMVVTHETGHNFGSKHTHWCGWNTGNNGSCGSIDNCYNIEPTSTCTTCTSTINANAPPTGFQGTIMSYCHLRSGIGINLANGFGPLPKATIRSTVSAGTCLISNNKWQGGVSTAWEDPTNWSCGSVPTAKTDVTIPAGRPNYPIINSAATCRSIKQETNTTVNINPTFTLQVTGPPSN